MINQPSLFSDFPETEADLPIVPSSEREVRVLVAERNQIELRAVDLEATLGPEHPATCGRSWREWTFRRCTLRSARWKAVRVAPPPTRRF